MTDPINSKNARLAALEDELATRGAKPAEPPLTPARVRLEAARAAAAALDLGPGPSTDAPTLKPGTIVHCLDDRGVTVPRSAELFGEPGVTLYRGDEIQVTAALLDAARDKFGRPGGIALANNEPEQMARWGRVRFRVGPAPADLETWSFGTPAWSAAREQARQAAWAEPDPGRRAEALRRVQERFGDAPVTSVTLNAAPDPSVRAATEQSARLAANGVRYVTACTAREAGAER